MKKYFIYGGYDNRLPIDRESPEVFDTLQEALQAAWDAQMFDEAYGTDQSFYLVSIVKITPLLGEGNYHE